MLARHLHLAYCAIAYVVIGLSFGDFAVPHSYLERGTKMVNGSMTNQFHAQNLFVPVPERDAPEYTVLFWQIYFKQEGQFRPEPLDRSRTQDGMRLPVDQ
jgi:hypothetical protein